MEYEHIAGPNGLDIRMPASDYYRTCSVCGSDPDPSLSADSTGVRVAFACAEHGVQSVVDPFSDLRGVAETPSLTR